MGKLFFNKGFISDLILLGKASKHVFFPKKRLLFFSLNHFVLNKKGLPKFIATIVSLPNIAGGLHNLETSCQSSEPRH